jgi:hypothetical protein
MNVRTSTDNFKKASHISMTKKALLEALEPFGDDDHIVFDGMECSYVPKVRRVCGGQQAAMPYFCTLEPGHEGQCYCSCKNVHFDRESPEEIRQFFADLNQ